MENVIVGLDKLDLGGLTIIRYDLDYLQWLADKGKQIRVISPNQDGVWNVSIADNHKFGDLVLGANVHNNMVMPYAYISLSPTHAHGDNWQNMSKEAYDRYIDEVLGYIKDTYHITLSSRRMYIRGMEINCDIPLSAPYAQYNRPCKLLMSLLPDTLKGDHNISSRCGNKRNSKSEDASTCMRKNKSTAVVIYNKSDQMRAKKLDKGDGVAVEDGAEQLEQGTEQEPVEVEMRDIMRIELRLLDGKKIKRVFGSNHWSEIDDEMIRAHYREYITDTLRRKYERWADKRRKQLKTLMARLRKEFRGEWYGLTMQYVRNHAEADGTPYVLDVEQVGEAILLLPDKNRNRYRTLHTFYDKVDIKDDVYRHNDRQKVAEILGHLEVASASPCDAEKI